jgi:hypothetical protein
MPTMSLGRAVVGQVKSEKGEMQRGVQENLWPKFIFKGAPLRATSSADNCSTRFAKSNSLKIRDWRGEAPGRNFPWRERITLARAGARELPTVAEIVGKKIFSAGLREDADRSFMNE